MSEESGALVPAEERTVEFYGDEIKGGRVTLPPSDSGVYVPIRPLTEFLGVGWRGQRERIQRDPVLSEEVRMVVLSTAGGPQEMTCLPLEFLNGWLFGISASRVKDEIRDRLITYQRECYHVLAEAFQAPTDLSPEAADSVAALRQIRSNALAVASLAEEQIRLTERLDRAAVIVGQHGRRITDLERRLAPPNAITDEQAAEIAQKVKAVAMQLTEANPGNNYFQSIFSEIHRRWGVSSYKNVHQGDFHNVMEFLDEWAAAAGGDDA